jgi:hypothetical protein
MLIGDIADDDEGRGRLMAMPGIMDSKAGWLAAMQETLYRDAVAPTATGIAVLLERSQV